MESNLYSNQSPYFRVLNDRQIVKIYQAALEVLIRTGVNVYNEEARQLLAGAGADVDGIRVRIPAHIVQDAIASNPRSFTLWGRDSKHRMQIVPDRVYYGPGPTTTYVHDPKTGERRAARRGDPGQAALVADALENIDYAMGLGLISDVDPWLAPVYEFAEMVANTSKPILPWAYTLDNMVDIYDIALAAVGGEEQFRRYPFIALFTTYHPPLQHTDEELANALWAVEHNIPVVYLGGGTAGTTAPITGAGLLVTYLAGSLSGLAILQLKKRGAAVCIGGVPQPADMRTGRPAYGAPEMSLYAAAMCDISRYLGVPAMGTAGASEAKVLDLQAAIESSVQVVLSSLSGATLVHDVGFLDCAEVGSLEMLVMNDEIIAMSQRIMRGIEVSDETMMLDLIDEVGPGGEFLTSKPTADLCRTEVWTPDLLDRSDFYTWQMAGEKTMHDRIKQRLADILESHKPAPLPEGAEEKIKAILQRAEARQKDKGEAAFL